MPTITRPDGVPINVPNNINGRELRDSMKIPPNQILTKIDKNGKETLIKNDTKVSISEGDQMESVTSFERGMI